MTLLFAAAEIYPYAKTGGLADVAQALPAALKSSIDVISVMPLYSFIDTKAFKILPTGEEMQIDLGEVHYTFEIHYAYNQGVKTLFLYEPTLCERVHPYGIADGAYSDNALRFALFSKAIVALALKEAVSLLHLNDWHTALAALYLKEEKCACKSLFTIHNLAFQGLFEKDVLEQIGVDKSYYRMEALEFWGRVNYMKAAIAYSDAMSTVSPSYAKEILTAEYGCGLEGFLEKHKNKLSGILNGINTDLFDPEHDPALYSAYSADKLEGKRENRAAFLQEHHFKDHDLPLFIFIGRMTEQKGVDLLVDALDALLALPINMAFLGDGSQKYEHVFHKAATHENFYLYVGYDEALSHRYYAAADFLLMPSHFEPCGLNQMIAARYGTLPVVHSVGGLKDSVHDLAVRDASRCIEGVVMEALSVQEIIKAVKRAIVHYNTPEKQLQSAAENMNCDLSFKDRAAEYLKLYRDLL